MSLSHFADPTLPTMDCGNLSQPDNAKQLHFVNTTTPKGIGDMTVADLSRIIEQSCPWFFDFQEGLIKALAA